MVIVCEARELLKSKRILRFKVLFSIYVALNIVSVQASIASGTSPQAFD